MVLVNQKKSLVFSDFTENIFFFLSLHYNADNSYVVVNKMQICKFRGLDNVPPYLFHLGSGSKYFVKNIPNKTYSKQNRRCEFKTI